VNLSVAELLLAGILACQIILVIHFTT